jgi:hypothetical protein
MYPQTTDECWFSSESMLYKSLSSAPFVEEEENKVATMLALSKKEKLFLVDHQHNIFSYSLDEHFLLKKLSPKMSFVSTDTTISTLALTASESEEVAYFITPERYYIFNVESLGLEMYFLG